nr:pentatricopeptide repeat protein AaPPR1417 [Agave angustifolia]UPT49397.1 pentatricopeptide repeat protein AaPPR389 [Agave angustifolia]
MTNMYFRCGEVECAERVMEGRGESALDRLMMINGYVFNERYAAAVRKIRGSGDLLQVLMADSSVVVSVITACANLGLIDIGRKVHGVVVMLGDNDNVALGSALIDMYCKCSSFGEARKVFFDLKERQVSHWNSMIAGCVQCGLLEEAHCYFDEMPSKNVISWTAMISGYVQCGLPQEGLRLLARLYGEEGLAHGNCYTFASALNACSSIAALDAGKQVHGQALKTVAEDGEDYLVLATALVDMYSKSGNLSYARRVFDRMGEKNVVSWTSMITGYATHGYGLEAIGVLEQMMSLGVKPNEVTFVAILNACSHSGLVAQGMHYFNLMMKKYGISPRGDHYACLVDMLGRTGKLEEAWKVVQDIKDKSLDGADGHAILGALLAGCQMHGNVEIGSKVAEEMTKRRKQTSDAYVALSNVYATAEMWDRVCRVREEWKKQGVVREPGLSLIQTGIVS